MTVADRLQADVLAFEQEHGIEATVLILPKLAPDKRVSTMIGVLKDWLCINRYRMYRRDRDGSLYEIGTSTLTWWDVKALRELSPYSVFRRDKW